MGTRGHIAATPSAEPIATLRAITVIMGTVVGLTFLFGFGNVLNLALRLGVPVWVAPLVAPAVDLSILGLLLGIRHLALAGASLDALRPARRLLVFASVVTLALNVADPLVAGEYGKAAFDAVGPLLLIGWAEVGPGFLQAIAECTSSSTAARSVGVVEQTNAQMLEQSEASMAGHDVGQHQAGQQGEPQRPRQKRSPEMLLELARWEDTAHRTAHQKPISADTLRVRLSVGAAHARQLVKIVRSEFQAQASDVLREGQRADAALTA